MIASRTAFNTGLIGVVISNDNHTTDVAAIDGVDRPRVVFGFYPSSLVPYDGDYCKSRARNALRNNA